MDWNPSAESTEVEAPVDRAHAVPGSVLVEHFEVPYVADLADGHPGTLFDAARVYLATAMNLPHVRGTFDLPDGWQRWLETASASDTAFGWLPFETKDRRYPNAPHGSFLLEGGRLAVLFASQRLNTDAYLGSGFGFAVPVHLHKDSKGARAWFHGFSASLPHGSFFEDPPSPDRITATGESFTLVSLLRDTAAQDTAQNATGLTNVVFRGVRLAAPKGRLEFELHGVGRRVVGGMEVPYAVTVQGKWENGSQTYAAGLTTPLVAEAVPGSARVFGDDPSSHIVPKARLVRPSRKELDAFRRDAQLGAAANVVLEHPAGNPLLKVLPCPRFVPADRPPVVAQNARSVALAGQPDDPPVRSNDASAVQAFLHAKDLYERLEAYGWTLPADYFRVMKPDLRILYRSGISPGPGKDGRTVNARVIPEGWPPNAMGQPSSSDSRPAVYIHLASADLHRRERAPWTPGGDPSPAVPFGVGADPRWLWHEFGHVLLVASTGELEFRFAHSAGDALAAIVADPESQLQDRRRGMTFPFVFLPRYHNRCAHQGWSWSGTQHAGLAGVPDAKQPRPKGYASEQILSSSLFRLYRCIGGDTCTDGVSNVPNRLERLRASHYALFLIMRAIFLMGDARNSVIATPAQFVHLLKHADRGAEAWSVTHQGKPFARVGGTARKVIRWAFEAQGLYGTGDATGAPKKVDVYIRDLRPLCDLRDWGGTDFGPGSYVPVSLHWQAQKVQNPPEAEPLWQSDRDLGIVVRNAGTAHVLVGNRGQVLAKAVQAELWMAPWADNTPPPVWGPGTTWTPCTPLNANATDIAPDAAGAPPAQFTFSYIPPPQGRYVLFASATCADDPSNIDPLLGLACLYLPTRLDDLVPSDNNLALRVLT